MADGRIIGRIIVIGGGAAGIWSALAARRAGADVMVLRQAPGATAVSAGCIDLGAGTDAAGNALHPVAAAQLMGRTQSHHPYAILRALLPSLTHSAEQFLQDVHHGLGLRGAGNRNLQLATPLGNVKEAWLAQGSIARGDLAQWPADRRIGVIDLPNRTAFDARLVAAGLASRGRDVVAVPVPFSIHPFATSTEVARRLETVSARQEFVTAAVAAAKKAGASCLLLPAVTIASPEEIPNALVREGLAGAAEIIGVPPSVPGLRLERDLEAQLTARGVPLVTGAVRGAVVTRGRVERLRLDDGRELEADAFVLATGRFIGGGIRHDARFLDPSRDGQFRETVFGLPVFVEGEGAGDKWIGDLLDRNAAGVQSALKAGIAVDAHMRPVDAHRRPLLENLFAAGSVIGGYDPGRDGSGLGVAVLTAMVAAEHAVAEAHAPRSRMIARADRGGSAEDVHR